MPTHRIYRTLIISGLVVTVLGVALAATAFQRPTSKKPDASQVVSAEAGSGTSKGASSHSAKDARPVRVFVVGSSSAEAMKNSFTGTVRARYETSIAFRISGKILKRHVEVGQRVKAGAPLFELDPQDYELQQKSAQASLTVATASVLQATAEEKRLNELRRSDAVSASEYDRALSARDIALGQQETTQKQLELANNQLSYCVIKADNDGVITSIAAEAGQVVTAGMRVCDLAHGGELEAVVDIPENRNPPDPSQKITVAFWSLPNTKVNAVLREISPIADPITRTYRCRFSLKELPSEIKLGMTSTVQWSDADEVTKFSIPSSSLLRQDKHPAVWTIAPDTGFLTLTPVNVSVYGDETIVVDKGLVSGQWIVSAGVQKLDASIRVRPWEIQK